MPDIDFRLSSPLGADTLKAYGFRCDEGVSRLYQIEIDLFAEPDEVVAFNDLLGKPMALEVVYTNGTSRYLSGIVAEFVEVERQARFKFYRATVVPKLWLLQHTLQCRIFQQQSVPDVLQTLLKGCNARFSLNGTYPSHNYCVQFRESDFAFVSRLMEEEGIYYYFEHGAAGSTMVVEDASNSSPSLAGQASIPFSPPGGNVVRTVAIDVWKREQRLRPGKVTLWDHSFELPNQDLAAQHPSAGTVTAGSITHQLASSVNSALELYEPLAGYAHRYDGIAPGGGAQSANLQGIFSDNQRLAKLRMEEAAADAVVFQAVSNCPAVCPGYSFSLTDHYDANDAYFITAAAHSARLSGFPGLPENEGYSNRFTCIPRSAHYRTPRTTPRPRIDGVQTATVVGTPGEEITTDPYGRIKVLFHWERQGANSCWVRVGQFWAGNGWGSVQIPRVGMEVIVSFIDGDPDWPIVVGTVYNGNHATHHALPANRNRSGYRSHSINGSASNYSEIIIEDSPGQEFVNIHSEKNLFVQSENTTVNNVGVSLFVTVGVPGPAQNGPGEGGTMPTSSGTCYDLLVHGFFKEDVTQYKCVTIGTGETAALNSAAGDYTDVVNNNRSLTTVANETELTKGNKSTTVQGNVTEVYQQNLTSTITGNETRTVQGNQTLQVDKDRTTTITLADTCTVDGLLTLNANASQTETITGNRTTTITVDDTLNVQGSQSINITQNDTMTVGGNLTVSVTGNSNLKTTGNHSHHVTGDKSESTTGATMTNFEGATLEIFVGLYTSLNVGATIGVYVGLYATVALISTELVALKLETHPLKTKEVSCEILQHDLKAAQEAIVAKVDGLKAFAEALRNIAAGAALYGTMMAVE